MEEQNVVGETTLWGKTGIGTDKKSKGHRKLEDYGRGLFPAVEGHSLE